METQNLVIVGVVAFVAVVGIAFLFLNNGSENPSADSQNIAGEAYLFGGGADPKSRFYSNYEYSCSCISKRTCNDPPCIDTCSSTQNRDRVWCRPSPGSICSACKLGVTPN